MPSIENALLPKINIKKAQSRSEWKPAENASHSPLSSYDIELQRRFFIQRGVLYNCFPIRITIMFFNKALNGGKRIMVHDRIYLSSCSHNHDMFVDFMISTTCTMLSNFFIPSEFMFKKTEIPIWEISIL